MDILKDEAVIKEVIDDLIQTATTYDLNKLENIYHDDLSVIMIDVDDNLNTANKETFKGIFKSKKEAGDPPMSTWAKYHKIDINDMNAHVIISRKNNLSGRDQILLLSIDLIFEDNRWQVIREVIFLRPDLEK
ncbi:MAG: hypothetical protein ACE37L_13745 [Allomuricauda sp.]